MSQRKAGQHVQGRKDGEGEWEEACSQSCPAFSQPSDLASGTWQRLSLKGGSYRASKLPHPFCFLPDTPGDRRSSLKLQNGGSGLQEAVRTRAHRAVSCPRPDCSGVEKFGC